ncbi:MAG TPA: hypothetical protein VFA11_13545 [Acidimicrobiales bacterium]|nr:hypothetical protein [Acidimicrobiales bacterium]
MDEPPGPEDWAELDHETGLDRLDGRVANALPPAVERWRQRSAAGAVLTGIALGLREALGGPHDQPAIVMDAPGEPPGPPQPVELKLDPDSPAGTVVVLRPWLMRNGGDQSPPGH